MAHRISWSALRWETIMSWLVRLGYFIFAAGVLTPILGGMLDRDLHRDRHLYFTCLTAVLCLVGLLMLSIGRRNSGGTPPGSRDDGSR